MTNKIDVERLISTASIGVSRWELDNIVWHDRTFNPKALLAFLTRISDLRKLTEKTEKETKELEILEELADKLDPAESESLLSSEDHLVQQNFIEQIARQGALETLCNNQLSMHTMETMCKLNPDDFILAAKRSQDIINAVRELVIQGETLSSDVGGA